MVISTLPPGLVIATRRALLDGGATPRDLTDAVRSGALIRVRRGHYALPGTDDALLRAVRIGGRLTCVSALAAHGIWGPDPMFPHVALRHEASRLRSPADRRRALNAHNRDGCELHWWPLVRAAEGTEHTVGPTDALRHVLRCQPPHIAIAALDSALHRHAIRVRDLDAVFAGLPRRCRELRGRVDPRCESGIETIVRLLLEALGLPAEPQVEFDGIGRVDFVVCGRIVVETDGHLGHADERAQLRDHDRDAALAARGYVVLRFNYRQVMFERWRVVAAIRGAVASVVP